MEALYPGVYQVSPSKVTASKYRSFFVTRPEGNLLIPCFSSHSTIHSSFDEMATLGGLNYQLLGDSHFRTPHCDEVAERFGAPLYCSEVEAPDVTRTVKQVKTFPFERHLLAPGLEVIPTPGHRPGGVCYLVTVAGRTFLFVGDAIWHDDHAWIATPSKAGRKQMIQSLQTLAELEFDVLLANTRLGNPICLVEVDAERRREFIERLLARF
jgi:hydroxyacylglutathione hydrolase